MFTILDAADAAARRLAAGDASALAELVHETSGSLLRVAARLLADEHEAEDVLQVAYLSAFRALVGGKFDARAGVRSWLHRIVVNRALDVLRRRRPLASPERADEQVATSNPEAALALRELAELSRALPPEQYAALVLCSLEGHSAREAAELMACSEGAIEQRLVRARATLRRWVP